MKRIVLFVTFTLFVSLLQAASLSETAFSTIAISHTNALALTGKKGKSKAAKVKKVKREPKKGHSKAAKVKKASHEPRKGKSKAAKVKKAKAGKNYTKHSNYP